jgi:hypothetical protein
MECIPEIGNCHSVRTLWPGLSPGRSTAASKSHRLRLPSSHRKWCRESVQAHPENGEVVENRVDVTGRQGIMADLNMH